MNKAKEYPEDLHPLSITSNRVKPCIQLTRRTRHVYPANSSTWRVSLLVILSRAPTQSLIVLSDNAKLRTYSIRVPALGSSAGSGATTDRHAVGAYDTDVADRVNDVRSCTSLLVLVVLTDVSVSAAGKITGRRGTFGAGPTVHAWRTCELAVFQSISCASLLVLVILTDLSVGTTRKVACRRGADRAGTAVETRRT